MRFATRLVDASFAAIQSAAAIRVEPDPVITPQDGAGATGDALASACLFGIVGGLLVAVAIVATIPTVLAGAMLGAIVGVVVAYQ